MQGSTLFKAYKGFQGLNRNLYLCAMAGNTFGEIFRLTSFGESHGKAIGGIVDGCPAGLPISEDFIQKQLNRRKPGQSRITTQRKESDDLEILSGVFEGMSLGTPIGFILKNKDAKSKDYDHLKSAYRPSHADFTYQVKYGIRDHRGGGRSSARETACRVVGGAIAMQILESLGLRVRAYVSSVGTVKISDRKLDLTKIDDSIVRCPDPETAERMIDSIEKARKEGNTLGGVIKCLIERVPAGWGEPVFDRIEADLAKAMMSINAVKGFSIGSGFSGASMKGSDHNDIFDSEDGNIRTITNHSGGVQGGITNGMDIHFSVAFKPVATLLRKQKSVNPEGEKIELEGRGRHDPCVVPRAVPIVESMASLVLVDHYLRNRSAKLNP